MRGPAVTFSVLLLIAAVAPRAQDGTVALTGGVRTHIVSAGESLRAVGSRYGVDPQVLAKHNGLRATAALRAGECLQIDNRHIVPRQATSGALIVNVPQRMLFLLRDGVVFAAPVAAGSAGWRTPLGPFTIIETEENPTWDVPASILAEARARGRHLPAHVPPGPANPLGRHFLRLSMGSVGVHGTNAPASIYQTVTHGCIRMHPDDVAVLYGMTGVGTPGAVVYEPILLAAYGDDVFLEAHADVYRRLPGTSLQTALDLAATAGLSSRIDWTRAAAVIAAREGIARRVTLAPAAKSAPRP